MKDSKFLGEADSRSAPVENQKEIKEGTHAAPKPKWGVVAKEVLTNPGVGYNFGALLLFLAGTNIWGAAACGIALGVSALAKALAVSDTHLFKKDSWPDKILRDPKTPLLTNAFALAAVSVIAISIGAWIPAAASALWSFGSVKLAQSLEKAQRDKEKNALLKGMQGQPKIMETKQSTLSMMSKRGEVYINIAAALSSLIAGNWVALLLSAPLLIAATKITLDNARQGKPEYEGYPKIVTALARGVTAAVGVYYGNWLPAAAFAVFAGVFVKVECGLTPGGGRKILEDIKGGVAKFLGGKKTKQAPSPLLVPVPLSMERNTGIRKLSADINTQSNKPAPDDVKKAVKIKSLTSVEFRP
ncbi:MAG: hypothetical protein V1721_03120 [Pseudomonadota bacterium]